MMGSEVEGASGGGPAVEFRSLVCLADGFPVLAGVDLTVERGAVVWLSGPNGAGKTSVLRAAAGLLRVTSGEAIVLGHDLRAEPAAVRPAVGLLGHASGLYEELTVDENLGFWAAAAGVARDDVRAALRRVGMEERLGVVPVARLSSGQRRRASLAAMLVRRPLLWLLDEPHAGLDRTGRDLIDSLVAEARAAGATVLIASHDGDRAARLCTEEIQVHGGATSAGGLGAR